MAKLAYGTSDTAEPREALTLDECADCADALARYDADGMDAAALAAWVADGCPDDALLDAGRLYMAFERAAAVGGADDAPDTRLASALGWTGGAGDAPPDTRLASAPMDAGGCILLDFSLDIPMPQAARRRELHLPIRLCEVKRRWSAMPKAARPDAPPLTPIIEAYERRPREVEPNEHPRPILPARIAHGSRSTDARLPKLYTPAHHTAGAPRPDAPMLPGFGFAPPGEDDTLSVALPLALYQLTDGPESTRGRAAPLALRIFVESLLSSPLSARRAGYPAELRMPLSDMLSAAFPNRAPTGKRLRELWPRLKAAIDALDSAWLPLYAPDTERMELRRVVMVSGIPAEPTPDAEMRITVSLPVGSHRGPTVDRERLRQLGVTDKTAYRLYLGLAYHLHAPGRSHYPAGRRADGGGQYWAQSRRRADYEPLTDAELASLAYPGRMHTEYRRRARRALDKLFEAGDFEDGGEARGGRYILPAPPDSEGG